MPVSQSLRTLKSVGGKTVGASLLVTNSHWSRVIGLMPIPEARAIILDEPKLFHYRPERRLADSGKYMLHRRRRSIWMWAATAGVIMLYDGATGQLKNQITKAIGSLRNSVSIQPPGRSVQCRWYVPVTRTAITMHRFDGTGSPN
jgi:hypothetical protein